MTFYFANHASLYIFAIKLFIGILGLVVTEFNTIKDICVESRLLWYWKSNVYKQVWGASINLISQ